MGNKLKTGDMVYSKCSPGFLLMVRRQNGSSVYCTIADGSLRSEMVYDEESLLLKGPEANPISILENEIQKIKT